MSELCSLSETVSTYVQILLARNTEGWAIIVGAKKDMYSNYLGAVALNETLETLDGGTITTLLGIAAYGIGFGLPTILGNPDKDLKVIHSTLRMATGTY